MTSRKDEQKQRAIVEEFVNTFHKLDEMRAYEGGDPDAWQLAVGETDQYGSKNWRPLKFATPTSALDPLYARLPVLFRRCSSPW